MKKLVLVCLLSACTATPRTTTVEERVAALSLLSMVDSQIDGVVAKLRIAVNQSETKPVKWADLYARILALASAL